MFMSAKNGILTGCFTPCAANRSLLKTLALAERRAGARKVLLHSIDGSRLNWSGIFEQSTSAAASNATSEHDDFNTPWSFERENSVAENSTTLPQHERTPPAPNQ